MFNKAAKFSMLPPGRPVRSVTTAANDNRRNAGLGALPRNRAPRPVCRWALSPDTGRPVCRWELDTDEPSPRLRGLPALQSQQVANGVWRSPRRPAHRSSGG